MRFLTSMIALTGVAILSTGCIRPASQRPNKPAARIPVETPAATAAGEVVLSVPGLH